jgi:hypothetical protein
MRGVLGLVLIGVGLTGAYLVLSGNFPPQPASSNPSTQKPAGTGSGGESFQSSFNQLGYSLAMQGDKKASRGFKQ